MASMPRGAAESFLCSPEASEGISQKKMHERVSVGFRECTLSRSTGARTPEMLWRCWPLPGGGGQDAYIAVPIVLPAVDALHPPSLVGKEPGGELGLAEQCWWVRWLLVGLRSGSGLSSSALQLGCSPLVIQTSLILD